MSVPVIVEVSKGINNDCGEIYKVFYLAKSTDPNVPLPQPIQVTNLLMNTLESSGSQPRAIS